MALGVADALADAFPLELGDSGEDGQHELGDAIAGYVAAKIEEPQRDLPALEIADHVERIPGGAKHPVELGGDNDVARLERSNQPRAFWTITERNRARDPALDEDLS